MLQNGQRFLERIRRNFGAEARAEVIQIQVQMEDLI